MALVLAIKNQTSIVVATDSRPDTTGVVGQIITLPNHGVVLVVGNLEAVWHAVTKTALPRVNSQSSIKSTAELIYAAMVLEVLPGIANVKGRVEVIVVGIEHTGRADEPVLYYMDSAQDFRLDEIPGDAVAAGATAAVRPLVAGHSYADSSVSQLKVLAKECMSATKLRWPQALSEHLTLGVVTSEFTNLQELT